MRHYPALPYLALAAALLAAGPSLAQTPAPADTSSTTAYKQAAENMMAGMDKPLTGDPDRDFVDGMLPHHEGAIAMAQVELRYGRDPELRRLAHDIIVSQQKEVVFMRRWQLQHPPAH